ncbi:MAG: FHA domain-containing protein [Gammaproteobacteria bacterium]|nr:FHA domain-containing protein [Gammaproteobacteria bacterium]
MVLNWQDRREVLTSDGEGLSLGADPLETLQIDREFASGHHAHIECQNRDFVLVDHSTNGTYVQTEDERITFVRRSEMRLWGNGWISLGEPLSDEAAIRFQHG